MKTKIIILISFFTIITSIFGQEKQAEKTISLDPKMLTPQRTAIFIEISNFETAESTLNIYSKYLDTPGYFNNLFKFINFLKEKVNKDVLKNEFLKTSGMDTTRSIYMSYVQEKDNQNNNIIFIPVLNEKEFPLLFIKILKSMKKNESLDLTPVTTSYKEFKINQILKDIFYSTIDGYFILTSSGDLLKEIIDIKSGPNSPVSLANDLLFNQYISRKDASCPVNIFIKGKSLSEIDFKDFIPNDLNSTEEEEKTGAKNASSEKVETPAKKPAQVKKSSRYDFIDYIGLGLKNESDKLNIKLYLLLDKGKKITNLMLLTFSPGYADKTLFIPDPLAYGFLSVDLKSLADSIDKPEYKNYILLPLAYGKLNYYFKSNLGIDMMTEFMPYFGNLFNIVTIKSKKRRRYDNYIVYFPIVNSKDNKEVYQKISASIKKQFNKPGTYGETQIEGLDTFWFADTMGNKNYFFIFDNKFFMINDPELVKYFKQDAGKNLFEVNKEFSNDVSKDSFLFLYVKFDNETLTKMLIGMMLINIDPKFGPLINKIDTMKLTGNKIENFLNFNINLKLLPDNK